MFKMNIEKMPELTFFSQQFLFKEHLKYLLSDVYKHLLKYSFMGG